MIDLDAAMRRLSDLEAQVREQGYRIKALEKAGDTSPVRMPTVVIDVREAGFTCNCNLPESLCRTPYCANYEKEKP